MTFISKKQADGLAQAAVNGETDKEILKSIFKENPAIDIALFGRMLAADPSLNEDASSQVAHAISTHAVENEPDFFTAFDDLTKKSGAGMLGTIEFNSSTLYRYANVAVHEFIKQIGDKDAAVKALELFIEALVKAMPTGKSNTFANLTLPEVVIVSLRNDRPVNLVTAFEEPVKSSSGYMDKSAERLYQEFDCVQGFASEAEFTLALSMKEKNAYKGDYKVENVKSIEQLLNAFADNMAILLS